MWEWFLFAALQIRVTFVNEFGVEEAGIDGGGIFKDFMENITRAAFDVQYGLFKVRNVVLLSIFNLKIIFYYVFDRIKESRLLKY